MLTQLSVRHFALLEDVRLEFGPGLNVLTGETGAGKTIVVEALGLALGDKAAAVQARQGADRLSVTAAFRVEGVRLRARLREMDLAPEAGEDLILRREVEPSGRSRAFVNDKPVSLAALARVGELLVHSHGQHDHQLLLKAAEQRDVLDEFGGLEPARADTAAAHAAWKAVADERAALSLSEQERAQRLDLYRFQRRELDEADPKPGEEEVLERLLPQLKNAEKLKALSTEALEDLSAGDGSALEKVHRAVRAIKALQDLGADLGEAAEQAGQALIGLEEAARRVGAFQESVDLDPARVDEVLGRLDLLARLKKKYGPALEDVIAYRARVAAELDRLENIEGAGKDVDRRLASSEKTLTDQAAALSRARRAAAKKISQAVEREFREVGLPHAAFQVSVDPLPEGQITAAGADQIRFLFTPNPGEGERPLAEIASGGELSRVMLALKSVLAKTDPVPVLIFDEIDAGVGGTLGQALGKKLARLGRTHQVLTITHLASVAAWAGSHFSVEKEVRQDRTRTRVRRLDKDERVREIARMFGGAEGISVKHAEELLAASKES